MQNLRLPKYTVIKTTQSVKGHCFNVNYNFFQVTNAARGTTSAFCKLTVGNITYQSKVGHTFD